MTLDEAWAIVAAAKPGDALAGYTLVRRGWQDARYLPARGVAIWWVNDGESAISEPNLVGQMVEAASPPNTEQGRGTR